MSTLATSAPAATSRGSRRCPLEPFARTASERVSADMWRLPVPSDYAGRIASQRRRHETPVTYGLQERPGSSEVGPAFRFAVARPPYLLVAQNLLALRTRRSAKPGFEQG